MKRASSSIKVTCKFHPVPPPRNLTLSIPPTARQIAVSIDRVLDNAFVPTVTA